MSLLSRYEEYGSNDLICSNPDPNEMETEQLLNEAGLVASSQQNSLPSTSSYEANSLNDFTHIKPDPDDMECNVNKISQDVSNQQIPLHSIHETSSSKDSTCIKLDPNEMEYNLNKTSHGISNQQIPLKGEIKEEMICCQFCPFNDIDVDRLKFHTFTQHPSGAAVVNFGESDQDIKFFCVKETCNFSSTMCTVYEEHLMNCCPLHQTLSGKEKERLKSTLQFVFDFHNKHCFSDVTGLSEYFTTFNKAYRSEDNPVLLRKHMEHNDLLSVVSRSSSLSEVPSSIVCGDLVGKNIEGPFSSDSKPVPVFIVQNQNRNLIQGKSKMSENISSSVRDRNNTIERLLKIGPSEIEIRKSHSHMETQTRRKPVSCVNCDKCFQYHSNLLKHSKIHTGEKPFRCYVCNKEFTTSSNLKVHKRTHTGEKPYKCHVCDKAFADSSSLVRHKRTHSGEKPFRCYVCYKEFTTSCYLKAHKRTHSGEKPFKCNVCDKAFAGSGSLIRHKRIHTGEKAYKCDLCYKAFATSSNLIAHKRTHTGEKPFKCDLCDKTFSTSSILNTHKRTHTGEKPFKCNVCDKAFADSSTLAQHKRTDTPEKA